MGMRIMYPIQNRNQKIIQKSFQNSQQSRTSLILSDECEECVEIFEYEGERSLS